MLILPFICEMICLSAGFANRVYLIIWLSRGQTADTVTCCSPEGTLVKNDYGSNTFTMSSSVVNSSSLSILLQHLWSCTSTAHIACCFSFVWKTISNVEPEQALTSAINLCFGKFSTTYFYCKSWPFKPGTHWLKADVHLIS